MFARAEGFEPSNNETKTRGLTTWRHPNLKIRSIIIISNIIKKAI